MKRFLRFFYVLSILVEILSPAQSQINNKPLLLPEMTWVDVQEYLKGNDMVIIPMGSTEQHGPHLPLGADYLSAVELSKKISGKTRVIVAPILMVGYSEYHSDFPGTLSISTETMEQVVFECIESLIKHGFKKFLFFNAHGGNNIIQENLIHRIAQTTGVNAVSIGYGSTLWPTSGIDNYDWHAGKFETSLDLCLFPDLVQMDKAEKPTIRFPDETEKIRSLSADNSELKRIWEWSMIFVPEKTGKGGSVHEMSSNGVMSFNDPKDASIAYGQQYVDEIIKNAVNLIEAWKLSK
jgi:creatinine amidohydrolase